MAEDSDSRPAKRSRSSTGPSPLVILGPGEPSESTPAHGQETFTRDTDFWLGDGNLILLAGRTAFRVFRSVLMKKSAVFMDMFTAGSLDATETFDDCPIVRLPDHPTDLRDFLQYLIPCSALRLRDGSPTVEFAEVHAAIHLAHKYQCPDVEARALFILKKYYTSRLPQYEMYDPSTSTLSIPPRSAAIATVNIARLTDTPSMLPFAFYRLCDLEGEMVEGYRRRDGSVEHLSLDDLKLCIGAQRQLAWELAGLVERVFAPTPGARCRAFAKCTIARETIHAYAQMHAQGGGEALGFQRDYIAMWAARFGLCTRCKRQMLRRDVEERRRVWMRLPEMFGLEDDECGFADGNDGESGSDSD